MSGGGAKSGHHSGASSDHHSHSAWSNDAGTPFAPAPGGADGSAPHDGLATGVSELRAPAVYPAGRSVAAEGRPPSGVRQAVNDPTEVVGSPAAGGHPGLAVVLGEHLGTVPLALRHDADVEPGVEQLA